MIKLEPYTYHNHYVDSCVEFPLVSKKKHTI